MRTLTLSVLALIALLAACGPSTKQVALAKQARYQAPPATLFAATRGAVESKYKLLKADEAALGMQTVARWYTRDGMVSRGTDENFQDIPDEAIRVTHVITLVPDGDAHLVKVTPDLMRKIGASPKPQPLPITDPSVPGWVPGQVDELQFAIYEALKGYEVKTPGGVAPAAPAAPTTPASPDGTTGTTDGAAPAPAPAP